MNRIEKFQELCGMLNKIVQEETNQDQLLAQDVLNRSRKNQSTVRVREKILRRVRSEVWEIGNHGTPKWDVSYSANPPSSKWKPLGYIQIATILGGNHSSWVKMAKDIGLSQKSLDNSQDCDIIAADKLSDFSEDKVCLDTSAQ